MFTSPEGGHEVYQALIVDDEKEIREGLASWTWREFGIEVAGCCAHGLEALQFMEEHPVDIVMTDIRMPFMDGLNLMEALNRRLPFVKVVILSGYNDFEYAKRAIQLGAIDYMLKPIGFADLSQAVRRLTARLDEQKQAEQRIEALKRKTNQLASVLRKNFLTRMFRGPLTVEELEQDGAEGEVLLEAESYTAGVLVLDRISLYGERPAPRELKLLAFSLENILNDIWDSRGHGYHLVDRHLSEVTLLSRNESDDANGEGRARFQDVVSQLLGYRGLLKSTLSVGIGMAVANPEDVYLSVLSARSSLAGYSDPASVLFGPVDLPAATARPPYGDSGEDAAAADAEALDEAAAGSMILSDAKQYMQNHYDRSITLKEVADHVYVSKGHLSALFKSNNETFLKYLTSIRMNKAKALMRDNEFKVYEIVEMVGYSDPAYFTELFKRHTGKTPNEYRGKLKVQRAN
jgi:two-component system response regulator YesN